MTLIDERDRSRLAEGRSWGIGFAFCKKEGDAYRTVMPITACRDYLNDQVYSEQTGNPYYAYGFSSRKHGCFDTHAYMAMGILPHLRTTTKCAGHDELEKSLMTPERGLESFLRHFEEGMGISPTIWNQIALNRMLGTLDLKWVATTYMISLWSLLVRVGLGYKEGDPMDFLKRVSGEDGMIVHNALPKIERMMAREFPPQDFSRFNHYQGIQNFPFPPKKS